MFNADNDYMNSSLRDQVEALKVSAKKEPTTPVPFWLKPLTLQPDL